MSTNSRELIFGELCISERLITCAADSNILFDCGLCSYFHGIIIEACSYNIFAEKVTIALTEKKVHLKMNIVQTAVYYSTNTNPYSGYNTFQA